MTFIHGLFDQLVHPIGWMLVHTVWQATVVAAVLALTLRLARGASANVRYAFSLSALLAVLLAAAATTAMQPRAIRAPIPIQGKMPLAVRIDPRPAMDLPTVAQALPGPRMSAERLLPWLVAAWIVGVCGLSLWQFGGWILLHRYRRHAEPADVAWQQHVLRLAGVMGVRRVTMMLTSRLDVPIVIGTIRPVILVPLAVMGGLSVAQIEAILAHELAHVRRYDYLVNLIQAAIETLLFYHPAIWWISTQIRREREFCCDDLATGALGDRTEYVKALAALEQSRGMRLAPAAGGGGRGELLTRVRRLLQSSPARARGAGERARAWACAALLAMSCIVVAACAQIRAQSNTRSAAPAAQALPAARGPATAPATQPAWVFEGGTGTWVATSNWIPTSNPSGNAPAALTPTPIMPDDMVAVRQDYQIGPNDMLQVGIADLVPGVPETYKAARVSETGFISLPLVGEVKAAGLTEAQLIKSIAQVYRDKNLLAQAQVSVVTVEARNRTFSIYGAVEQPGQYQIVDSNLRLFDALALARGTLRGASIRILRQVEGQNEPRIIDIPAEPVRAGDPRINLVIRPRDFILVSAADVPTTRPAQAAAPVDLGANAELQRLAEARVAAAQEVTTALRQRAEGGQAWTLEFVQTLVTAARHLYDARIAAAKDSAARLAAAEQYLAECERFADVISKRQGQDAGPVELGRANSLLAEARYIVASMRMQQQRDAALKPFRVVVMPQQIQVDGRPSSWAEVRRTIEIMPERERGSTFLEIVAGSAQLPVKEFFDAQAEANRLRTDLQMANVSIAGIDPNAAELATGEYYMGGAVARTGVYSLTGRRITLRQAIIAAGGPEDLQGEGDLIKALGEAPHFVSIVRRGPGDGKSFINDIPMKDLFDGTREDIALKPDDQVMVRRERAAEQRECRLDRESGDVAQWTDNVPGSN